MKPYHKIPNVFARNPETKKIDTLTYSRPEFAYLASAHWLVDEKVDGTNIRVMWDGKSLTFGGRTNRAQLSADLFNRLQEMFTPEDFYKHFTDHEVCLYGEGYGRKIQKVGSLYNPYGVDFILFDVNIEGHWLQRTDVEDVATKLGINVTPYLGMFNLFEAREMVVRGLESKIAPIPAEGVIVRPVIPLFDGRGNRIIGKIKAQDFEAA